MAAESPRIISRAEARALGLKRFFTGEPCKKGHVAWRCLSSCECLKCMSERQAAWWKANRTPAKLQKHRENWYARQAAKLQNDPQAAKLAAKREERRLWWVAKRAAERASELNAGIAGTSEGKSLAQKHKTRLEKAGRVSGKAGETSVLTT
jgi:hypothetical protein